MRFGSPRSWLAGAVNRIISQSVSFPALAVLAANEAVGRFVAGLELGRVPLQALLGETCGQTAEQHHFRERTGVVEWRARLAVAADRFDKLLVMVFALLSWQLVAGEFFGGQQHGSGNVRRVKHAFCADVDRALVGHAL